MSTTEQTPRPARPAPPYEGSAQHGAVRAAIKRAVPSIPTSPQSYKMWVSVTGQGTVRLSGSDTFIRCARVSTHPPRYRADAVTSADLAAATETIQAALVAAGWTVTLPDRYRQFSAYGPDADAWADRARAYARRAADEKQAAIVARAARTATAAELVAALGVGIVDANRGGYGVCITLTVEEAAKLRDLLAGIAVPS